MDVHLENIFVWTDNVEGVRWSQFIYASFPAEKILSSKSTPECGSYCMFPHEICHYYVYADGQCFLGNYGKINSSVIAPRSDVQSVHIYDGKLIT